MYVNTNLFLPEEQTSTFWSFFSLIVVYSAITNKSFISKPNFSTCKNRKMVFYLNSFGLFNNVELLSKILQTIKLTELVLGKFLQQLFELQGRVRNYLLSFSYNSYFDKGFIILVSYCVTWFINVRQVPVVDSFLQISWLIFYIFPYSPYFTNFPPLQHWCVNK